MMFLQYKQYEISKACEKKRSYHMFKIIGRLYYYNAYVIYCFHELSKIISLYLRFLFIFTVTFVWFFFLWETMERKHLSIEIVLINNWTLSGDSLMRLRIGQSFRIYYYVDSFILFPTIHSPFFLTAFFGILLFS